MAIRAQNFFRFFEDAEGKKKAILNKEETAIAQGKQDLIKQEFQDWIWKQKVCCRIKLEPLSGKLLNDVIRYYNHRFAAQSQPFTFHRRWGSKKTGGKPFYCQTASKIQKIIGSKTKKAE